ncbi:glycosyltransferase family 2 protein [Spirosoma sp. KNUC1025]|uniref:glycosyltransferase family 2 protein n=1 Tax=Spirosoma sp. KNUC1025 TaxID=2894082 RepID=UPI00386E7920|nr:glycosyltransferase [Spirosoma sp. KNUC1025]
MLPSISVITPSYNQGKYIRQTVESVLSQTYPELEYIVVDGLSTDDTLAVLEPYRDHLTLISERDNGQTDAINKGLRRASGDIVCWLNSDDFFLPDTLMTVGTYFEQHPAVLWLTGDCLIVDEKGAAIQEPVRQYKRLLRALSPSIYMGVTNAICQPATFWRRSLHDKLGYLNESLHYTMDYDWWLRLNRVQAPAVLKQPLTAFRIHAESKGGSEYEAQFAEDYRLCCQYWPNTSVRWLHKLHNELIKTVYRQIK